MFIHYLELYLQSRKEVYFSKFLQFIHNIYYHQLRLFVKSKGIQESEVNDIIHEVFLKLYRYAHNLPKDEKAFKAYLFRMVWNVVKDTYDKKVPDYDFFLEEKQLPKEGFDEQYVFEHTLKHLNQKQKQVFELILQDHTYKEIEDLTGYSNADIRQTMSRSRKKLQAFYRLGKLKYLDD